MPDVREKANDGTLRSSDITGYAVAKQPLYEAQRGKCAYCEWRVLMQYQAVEHYRPKTYYWWLSWRWDNLLFACTHCNSTHKGDAFPLSNPSDRLVPEQAPPGAEAPQIIDPASATDPVDHITYVKDPYDRWVPTARDGSALGASTITWLGLDQPPMIDEYQWHYRALLTPRFDDVRWAADDPSTRNLPRFWNRACRFTAPDMPFSALSYDALESEFGEDFRARHGLALPARP